MRNRFIAAAVYFSCVLASSWFVAYLLGSFVSWSWNPGEWTEHMRWSVSFLGSIFGGGIGLGFVFVMCFEGDH